MATPASFSNSAPRSDLRAVPEAGHGHVHPAVTGHSLRRPIDQDEALMAVAGAFAASADALSSWAMFSKPGRVCVYARVPRLSRGGVGERARQLAASGVLRLSQRRVDDDLFDYRAQRTTQPFRMPNLRAGPLSPEADLLLSVLVACADSARVCPSNAELAAMMGLRRANLVAKLMGQLRDHALIDVEQLGTVGQPLRRVTICETGAMTSDGRGVRAVPPPEAWDDSNSREIEG